MNKYLVSTIGSYDASMDDILEEFKTSLKEVSIEKLDLGVIKNITVKFDNKFEKLCQISVFNVKTPYLLHLLPVDNKMLKTIESSIRNVLSHVNINNDGRKIIIQVSLPNSDKRNLLVKKIKSLGEEKKIKLRNVRRNTNTKIKKYIKKNKKPTEYEHKYTKLTQKSIDSVIVSLDKMLLQKVKNIVKI